MAEHNTTIPSAVYIVALLYNILAFILLAIWLLSVKSSRTDCVLLMDPARVFVYWVYEKGLYFVKVTLYLDGCLLNLISLPFGSE